ncbi:polyphenol oxidase family protein [Ruania suaedae]|uniref:polyphenol oxidase family protein n=1 Tax=Ruania suaedae TaxID=2897774 RepID=UPI001E4F673E|nr:polyphenol oxidase family protein [Ruania suaedae]UFU04236.1 polyphenol oxidase family protein [Ruania suaedae]
MLTADLGPGVLGGFITRAGGVSRAPYDSLNLGGHVGDDPVLVGANRRALSDRIGAPTVFLDQRHSADVAVDPAPGEEPVADALVLTGAGAAAAVLVADCVPVLLVGLDARGRPGAVAAVHAGRRGLLGGVVTRAIEAVAATGHVVRRAAIGPAICGRCYEVPDQLQQESLALLPELEARTSWGTPALDLPAGARAQVESAGVEHVDVHAACTREDARWYSYRREGTTGRFAGVIRLDRPDRERHADALGAAAVGTWSSV